MVISLSPSPQCIVLYQLYMHQGMKHEPVIRFPDIRTTHYPSRKDGKLFSKVYSKSLLKGLHDVTCQKSPKVARDCPT